MHALPYLKTENAMRTYFSNLSPKTRMMLAVPLLVLAYPVITVVLPALVRALLPDAVRSVLSVM
ncbi:MAG: hypothetical protein JWQ87_5015 [Candidatus Sulfotelmatobacter sp.]|nr:hypothetical protein [Candidatus Sulfotelmatobacter sp.]